MAERKKNRNRRRRRLLRSAVLLVLAIVLVIAILFVTPIFNIKNISVSGNNVVSLDSINAVIGDMIGKNLFSAWDSTICERLKTIAYIDEAEVSRTLFPPTLNIKITECQTAAYFDVNGKKVIVNSDLKVLDDSNTFSLDGVPLIRGIEINGYTLGRRLQIDDTEKSEALSIFLKTMTKTEQLGDVLYFDLTSITDLKFSYKGQIDVICGSALELDKKLRMFKAVMTSGSLSDDARGTIDLTNPEQAVHTP